MSDEPETEHPWAKFNAPPAVPRAPVAPPAAPVPVPAAAPGKTLPLPPEPKPAPPVTLFPKPRALPVVPAPAVPAAAQPSLPEKPKAKQPAPKKPAAPAAGRVAPVLPAAAPSPDTVRPGEWAKPSARATQRDAIAGAAKEAGAGEGAGGVAEAGATGEAGAGLEDALAPRVRRAKRKKSRFWLTATAAEGARDFRATGRNLREWWSEWRRSATFVVLVAFGAIYGLLAYLRQPSEAMVVISQRAEEVAFLQDFLKSFCKAGGRVLAQRPHGGSELYPRGVVMQGELLDAFNRAPVGGTFTVTIVSPAANPLGGFYSYPPVYAGGAYFSLPRKFDFSRYRCAYLIRKDNEQMGTMLLARVEPAP